MDRERLTITIRKDILKKVDQNIDGYQIRNRSHSIEYLINKALPHKVKKALILAGGHGVKLRPLTYVLPKPMIPVNNRPILDYIIELLRTHNIRDLTISTGPLASKISDHFGDGSKFGVSITYIHEDKRSGTGGALKQAKELIGDDMFVLFHGDVLAEINLHEMIEFHESNTCQMTMAITTQEETGDWGVVGLRGNKIVSFTEKPHKEGYQKHINAGIYIINPKVIDLIPNKVFTMLEDDVIPKLVEQGNICGYVFDGHWFDVSTPKIYEQALKYWKK